MGIDFLNIDNLKAIDFVHGELNYYYAVGNFHSHICPLYDSTN